MNLSQEEKEQSSTKLIHYIKSCKCSMPNLEIVATPYDMVSHYEKLYGQGDNNPKCDDIIKMEVAPLKEYKCGYKWESWFMDYIRRINNTPDEETDFCLDFITECRTSALLLWNRIALNNIPYIHPMILIHFNKGNTTNTSLLDVNINVRSMQNFNYDDVFPEQMQNHYLWIFDTHEIDCEEYTHHTFSIVTDRVQQLFVQRFLWREDFQLIAPVLPRPAVNRRAVQLLLIIVLDIQRHKIVVQIRKMTPSLRCSRKRLRSRLCTTTWCVRMWSCWTTVRRWCKCAI